jgi:hypothetical protein
MAGLGGQPGYRQGASRQTARPAARPPTAGRGVPPCPPRQLASLENPLCMEASRKVRASGVSGTSMRACLLRQGWCLLTARRFTRERRQIDGT